MTLSSWNGGGLQASLGVTMPYFDSDTPSAWRSLVSMATGAKCSDSDSSIQHG